MQLCNFAASVKIFWARNRQLQHHTIQSLWVQEERKSIDDLLNYDKEYDCFEAVA